MCLYRRSKWILKFRLNCLMLVDALNTVVKCPLSYWQNSLIKSTFNLIWCYQRLLNKPFSDQPVAYFLFCFLIQCQMQGKVVKRFSHFSIQSHSLRCLLSFSSSNSARRAYFNFKNSITSSGLWIWCWG